MRDRLAKVAATCLIALMLLLAAFSALRLNAPRGSRPATPAPSEDVPALETLDADLVARGREIYEELSCGRCHRVGDAGNPRSPLDAVGARRSRAEIRAWLTADDTVRDRLSGSVIRAKEAFDALPGEQLDALVEYLSSLR